MVFNGRTETVRPVLEKTDWPLLNRKCLKFMYRKPIEANTTKSANARTKSVNFFLTVEVRFVGKEMQQLPSKFKINLCIFNNPALF